MDEIKKGILLRHYCFFLFMSLNHILPQLFPKKQFADTFQLADGFSVKTFFQLGNLVKAGEGPFLVVGGCRAKSLTSIVAIAADCK